MPSLSQTLRRSLRVACYLLAGGAIAVLGIGWWFQRNYPYGRDHCCSKAIAVALMNYADVHGGKFPAGGQTPEASLGLLYPDYLDAGDLRGKTFPETPTRQLLESGQPLTPETCGWQYVEGLSRQMGMSHRIALFWDKIGLGHNSEYLPDGGHTVSFMDAHEQVISGADWPRFLAEQEKAWAAIRRGETPEPPWVPGGF